MSTRSAFSSAMISVRRAVTPGRSAPAMCKTMRSGCSGTAMSLPSYHHFPRPIGPFVPVTAGKVSTEHLSVDAEDAAREDVGHVGFAVRAHGDAGQRIRREAGVELPQDFAVRLEREDVARRAVGDEQNAVVKSEAARSRKLAGRE